MRSFSRRPSGLTFQIFLGMTAILLVTLIIAIQYVHSYTMTMLTSRDEQIAADQLDSAQSRISQVFSSLHSSMDILMFDVDIDAVARERKTHMDYEYYNRVKAIYSRLSSIAATSEYIHSIYVYINDSVVISTDITNSVYPYSTDSIPIVQTDFYRQLSSSAHTTRISLGHTPADFHAYKDGARAAVGDLITLGCASARSGGGRWVVMINISAPKIDALLGTLFGDASDACLLIGDTVLSSSGWLTRGETPPFSLPGTDEESGQFPTEVGEHSGQIVYRQLPDEGFSLVKFMPQDANLRGANTVGIVFMSAFIACFLAALILVLIWIRRCLKPIGGICEKMVELENGNLGVQIDVAPRNELGDVIQHFNRMSRSLYEMDEENHRAGQALRVHEMRALRAQLNPHFIFNTLNMFKWMAIMHHADDLKECVVALAEILYPAFKESSEPITLKAEINCLEKYILILTHRFGNQVNLDISLPPELENAPVPRLIMQPIVENCIHHGRYADDRVLSIRVKAREENGVLSVSISDDGQGMPAETLALIQASLRQEELIDDGESGHIGLMNVHRRIALQYGRQYGVTVSSQVGEGTTVRIRLPLHRDETSDDAQPRA